MGEMFMTVEEVARETRAKTRCVRYWLAKRKLGYVKIGGRVRIPRAELEKFVSAGARPAMPVLDFKSQACGPDA